MKSGPDTLDLIVLSALATGSSDISNARGGDEGNHFRLTLNDIYYDQMILGEVNFNLPGMD